MAAKDRLLELQIETAKLETELRVSKERFDQAQNACVHIAAALCKHQLDNNETSLKLWRERAQKAEKENIELKSIVRYLQTEMAKSSQSIDTESASQDTPRGSRNATHTPNSSTDDSTGSGFNIEGDLLSFHDDDAAAATGRVEEATRLNQQLESPKEQTPVSAATNGRNGDADRYERAPLTDSGLSNEDRQPFEPDPVLGMPSDRKKIFNSDGSISWMEVYPDPPVSRPVDSHWRKQKQAQRDPWYRVHHNEWRQLVNLGMYVQQWGDAQWQEWARRHGRYGAATWKLYWEKECKERFEQVSKQREAAEISGEGTEEVADRVHNDVHEVPGKETKIDKDRTVSQHPKDDEHGTFIPGGRLVDFGFPASQTQAVKVEGEFPTLNKDGPEESKETNPLEQKDTTAQRSVCKDSEVLIDIDAEHASKHEGLSAPMIMDTIEPLTKSPSPSECITQSAFHDACNSSQSSAPTQGQDSVPTSGFKNLGEESPMTTAETFEEKKAPVCSKVSSPDYAEVAHELAATVSTPKGSKEEGPEVGGMSDSIAMPLRIAGIEETKKRNLVSIDSVMETPEVNIVENAPPSESNACKDTEDGILGKNAVTSTASIKPRQGQVTAPTGMAPGHALEHYSIPASFSRAQALPNAHPDLPDDAKRAIFSQLSTEHPYRTAVISNIPPETALTTVLGKVRGGKVMRSVLLPTNLIKSKPAMDGNVALIVFMDGPNAKAYVDECAEIQGIFFWSEQRNAHVKAKVALCHTPSNTCPGFLASPKAGFTRIVYLADNGAFSPKLVVGAVLKVYNRSQEERRSPGAPLRMGRNKDSNSLIMEWATLRDAFNAKNALDKMQWLVGGFDVGFLPDPCGGPVETLEEVTLAKDPATVRSIDYPIMWLPPTSQTACLAEADKAMSAGNPNCVWRTAQDYGHRFAEGIVETVGLLDAELMTQPGPSRGANEFKGRRPFGGRGQHVG
ncbi:hypothetical protein KC340_g6660 [Hortaea werneckii]|nr:hypothetical protein KC342_g6933 [Hortaea werneckii]KAI7098296.1 hypothetical protein KC339_g9063 [Hortaea werneckii]KAI7231705.1 hypothetical protein KC365_g7091 [Hortaea werneckii]KAI7323459.1 hypothetical protein KC340_g6660 [Hortaea werneckii]KAI7392492.1 hypothetical protein KC328_g7019 [Hortaea werneckii]